MPNQRPNSAQCKQNAARQLPTGRAPHHRALPQPPSHPSLAPEYAFRASRAWPSYRLYSPAQCCASAQQSATAPSSPARPHPRAGGDGGGEEQRAQGEREPEDEGAPEQAEQLEREDEDEEEQGDGGEGGRGGDEGGELGRGRALGAREERRAGGRRGRRCAGGGLVGG